MKKIDYAVLVACLLAVLVTDSRAGDWSEADTARQLAVTASLYADYRQTVYIFNHPERFTEGNPLIREPGEYFAACAIGHTAIAYLLPAGMPRAVWQNVTLAVQSVVVARNDQRGVRGGVGFVMGYNHAF